jgi:hypothetical protein
MCTTLLTQISGIPSIRSTEEDGAKADALANARAAVDAENKKEAAATGQKREREDDEGDAERQLKKADTKEVEAEA